MASNKPEINNRTSLDSLYIRFAYGSLHRTAMLKLIWFKELSYLLCKVTILNFTFPNHHRLPSQWLQSDLACLISNTIFFQFWTPIFFIWFRYCSSSTTGMGMPKTSVNKYYFFKTRKYKIRTSRKVLSMKSIAVTHAKYKTAYNHFRSGIFSLNTPHTFATFCYCKCICHKIGDW